jgi:hypothetical protein
VALPTDSWATRLQAAAAVVATSAALLLCGGIVQALSVSAIGSFHLRMTAASRAASTQVGILAVLSVLLVALQRLVLSSEEGASGRLPDATLVLVIVLGALVVAGGAFGLYDAVTGHGEFRELDFRTGAALERCAAIGLGALATWLALKVRADARAARDFYRDN